MVFFYKIQEIYSSFHQNHRRIATGIISVSWFLIAAKLVGMLKEIIVAKHYGVSAVIDAYVFAFTICTWFPPVIWSVGTVILVPLLVTLNRRSVEEDRFLRELNGLSLVFGLLAVLLPLVGGMIIVQSLKSWAPETQTLAQKFLWMLSPLGFLLIISASLSIRLQSREDHGYTFLEAMPALGIAFFVLASKGIRAEPLLWGTLTGAILQALLLIWKARHIQVIGKGVSFRLRSTYWKQMYTSAAVQTLGQVAITLTIPIDNLFAAHLGTGAVSILGYANRFLFLFSGFGATTVGRAMLPVLSRTVAEGNVRLARVQAMQWARLIFGGCGMVVLIVWLITPQLIALLFQRGAFTADDTRAVSQVLRFGLLSLPFYCSGIALIQYFASMRRYDILASLGVVGLVTKVALNAVLAPAFGVAGIALAYAGMYLINVILSFLFMGDR